MMLKTAYSTKESLGEAVADLKAQFSGFAPRAILFFASPFYDPSGISKSMKEAFKGSDIFGCTTSGEIVSGRMLKKSVVAMAFDSEVIKDIRIEVVESIKQENQVKAAFNSFEAHFKEKMAKMDFKKYVGIILVDGLSGSEEKLMETIGDLSNITFIGGSAGDDLKFKMTHVFANDKAYTNAAVLALIKPGVEFDIIKTQSFCPLGKKMVATKVNAPAREVIEFDNRPAAQVYAESVGTTVQDAPNHFMHNPIGLMVGEEPYVRSPQQVKDGSVVFYCNVLEGMELSLLESRDIVIDTKKALKDKIKEIGNISGIINFHCILRTLELEQKKQTEAYGEIFKDIPTIGFSTYGEEYLGHINQTSTMLVFK